MSAAASLRLIKSSGVDARFSCPPYVSVGSMWPTYATHAYPCPYVLGVSPYLGHVRTPIDTHADLHNACPMTHNTPGSVPEWTMADRLRKIRRDRHLTQEQIAREGLGVKAVTWSSWEAGRTHPHDVLGLAVAIERRFGVPAAWTLGILGGVEREQGNTQHPSRAPVAAGRTWLVSVAARRLRWRRERPLVDATPGGRVRLARSALRRLAGAGAAAVPARRPERAVAVAPLTLAQRKPAPRPLRTWWSGVFACRSDASGWQRGRTIHTARRRQGPHPDAVTTKRWTGTHGWLGSESALPPPHLRTVHAATRDRTERHHLTQPRMTLRREDRNLTPGRPQVPGRTQAGSPLADV